jgi:hypothetical protein
VLSCGRMNNSYFEKKFHQFEQIVGRLKFAVILLTIFAFTMIVGTFFESYFGTDFANRTVYKTWPFMLLQFLMFLSIVFAAFLRLPPKKRLYGFYTIHAGLIIVGAGSFITYFAGVDGSLLLMPNSPSREIILNGDQLKIIFPEDNREVKTKLPYVATQTLLGQTYQNITLKRYYPFATKEFRWKESNKKNPYAHSSRYLIANEMVDQEMTLSLHPESIDFDSSLTMGPLQVHYLPSGLAQCFGLNNPSGIIIWDQRQNKCYTPESKKISIQKANTGRRFFVIREGADLYSFFPDAGPWPLDKNLKTLQNSHLRVFSKNMFQDKPHLFLFGESTAFFNKDEQLWQSYTLTKEKPVETPWMGFELTLLEHVANKIPMLVPQAVYPIQKNNKIIRGETRAVEIDVSGQTYWVTNQSPLQLRINGKRAIFQLGKESLYLPFELVLERFKMNKDPGTNRPASYESFVRLFSNDQPSRHHIFMNNPLKYMGFTFYQASYSQDQQGSYSSTLSVNVDPGRFMKYLGCLMLVFGSMWHYYLNYRKKKNDSISPLVPGVS